MFLKISGGIAGCLLYETAKAFSCNYGNVLLFHRLDQLAWRCIRLCRQERRKNVPLNSLCPRLECDDWFASVHLRLLCAMGVEQLIDLFHLRKL